MSKFGVDTSGFGELVYEDDDAARRLQGGTAGDEFMGAGGDTELVAGVAAVSAVGALRGEEFRGVETAQECLSDAEDVGGLAHAVGGVVFVVEFAGQCVDCAVGCLTYDEQVELLDAYRALRDAEKRTGATLGCARGADMSDAATVRALAKMLDGLGAGRVGTES